MPLFQKQNNRRQVLQSLLIALSFTNSLESKHIKSAVDGFVHNARFYVSNQKTRGYLKKQGDLLVLTPKAKRLVQSLPIELISNKRGGSKQISHETALIRSLFLCLLHLNFKDIKQIKKQKRDSPYIPDLTIITETDNIFIEIDTGSQPIKTLQSKIKGFKAVVKEGTLIYFTNSAKTFDHFSQTLDVQFIYLQSPTLSQDIQKLAANTPLHSYKFKNSFTLQGSLSPEFEKVRAEALKLLYEDD